MSIDELTRKIIGLAMKVHTELGPGLFESAYETCLCHELTRHSLRWQRQVDVPIVYADLHVERAFRADLIVEDKVLIEIKSIVAVEPIHSAQLLTYLRFTGLQVGLLINFNVPHLRQGIVRKINSTSVASALPLRTSV
jgi:GxxExxY protein